MESASTGSATTAQASTTTTTGSSQRRPPRVRPPKKPKAPQSSDGTAPPVTNSNLSVDANAAVPVGEKKKRTRKPKPKHPQDPDHRQDSIESAAVDASRVDGPSARGGRGGRGGRGAARSTPNKADEQSESAPTQSGRGRRGGRGQGYGGQQQAYGSHPGYGAPPPSLLHMDMSQPPPNMISGASRGGGGRGGRGSTRGGRGRGTVNAPRGSQVPPPPGEWNVGAHAFVPRKPRVPRELNPQQQASETLRERVTRQLEDNTYECMICCHVIQPRQGVWTCRKCYHMFHISGSCIVDWARKSKGEDGMWRCPACQNTNDKIPYNYYCFCGKEKNPVYNFAAYVPHSCDQVCGRVRGAGCPHRCVDTCHPGPCPECPVVVKARCHCGRVEKSVRCGTQLNVKCDSVCGRVLACGRHSCASLCHEGECAACEETVDRTCHCAHEKRQEACAACDDTGPFSCGKQCDGMFACGLHKCQAKCHPHGESCGECPHSPARVGHCPCGKRTVTELIGAERKSCTDPIPTCEGTCDKVLRCGGNGEVHRCSQPCHTGPCPPCEKLSEVVCRCTRTRQHISCQEYVDRELDSQYLCARRCKKAKSCSVHKCNDVCCVREDHFCLQVCNKKLSCGEHRCERLCHAGQCHRCLEASFTEQFCHCGMTFREPPVPCGMPPPECNQQCNRRHACAHPVMHKCHSEQNCPPCTFLTEKTCHGGHEVRKNIPCYREDISCGRACGKPLSCGRHVCTRNCHGGACEAEGAVCVKGCDKLRAGCEHPCAQPCHEGECRPTACMFQMPVTCECGRLKKQMRCYEVEKVHTRMRVLMCEDAAEGAAGGAGEVSTLPGQLKRTPSMEKLNCLSCDDECKKKERNKKVAEALNIKTDEEGNNTDQPPMITYSDSLKKELLANPSFIADIECKMVELVRAANESPSPCVHLNLPPMGLEKRRVVHEYAEYFMISTVSVDEHPKRSVVATAKKGISRVPLVVLTSFSKYQQELYEQLRALKMSEKEAAAAKAASDAQMIQLKSRERVVMRRAPVMLQHHHVELRTANPFALLGELDENDQPPPPAAVPDYFGDETPVEKEEEEERPVVEEEREQEVQGMEGYEDDIPWDQLED